MFPPWAFLRAAKLGVGFLTRLLGVMRQELKVLSEAPMGTGPPALPLLLQEPEWSLKVLQREGALAEDLLLEKVFPPK